MSGSNGVPTTPKTKDMLGAMNSAESKSIPKLTPEQRSRYRKWWEWTIMGHTAAEILKREVEGGTKRLSIDKVHRGLEAYARWCATPLKRSDRLRKHKDFGERVKAIVAGRIAILAKKNQESGERGIKTTKTVEKRTGAILVEKTVTTEYRSFDRELIPLIRAMLEADRYVAQLDGLLIAEELDAPDEIEVDISGWFDLMYMSPNDAPELLAAPSSNGKNGSKSDG